MNGRVATLAKMTAVILPVAGLGQGRPRAEVRPLVETDGAHAGQTIRVALKVTLPEALHVQSDQPSDPSFIPTALSLAPPDGFSVEALMYPDAFELRQEGLPEPLVVFGNEFVIGSRLAIGQDVERTNANIFSADDAADVGVDEGTNVSAAYPQHGNRFTGRIEKVRVEVK